MLLTERILIEDGIDKMKQRVSDLRRVWHLAEEIEVVSYNPRGVVTERG